MDILIYFTNESSMKNNETLIALADTLEIDTDLLKEILILFFENMPGQLGEMRSSLKDQDFKNIHIVSHTLKGTAANLYYTDIAKAASDIEVLAIAQNEDNAAYESHFNKLELLLSHAKMKIFYQ